MSKVLRNEIHEFRITAVGIDTVAEKIECYLTALKMERKNMLRIRLSIEEILLKWRERFGENVSCVMRVGTQFGRPRISLEMPGERYDPLEQSDEDGLFSGWSSRLLSALGLAPVYSYANGKNQITLKLKKPRHNPIIGLLLAFALAILVGLLRPILPESFISTALENVITPVYDTFFGVLETIAGPMVFLAVAWGIYGIGDISALGRIGRRMLVRYLGISLVIAAFAAVVSSLMFSLAPDLGGGTDTTQLWSIFHMLLDIFPDNMVEPFIDGNTMQIILIAVFIGGALLVLGKQTAAVSALVEQLNYVVHFIMELITKLVPVFIFFVLVRMFWTDSFGVVTQAWSMIAVFLIVMVMVLGAVLLLVAARNKVSPLVLIKKCSDTFIIALTTGSSTAAFGTAMHCCERRLGVSNFLTNFGLPIGMVFYVPATVAYFLVISFYAAKIYAVEISLAWIVMAIVVSLILAVASPPILGGTLICYTMLFMQLGIPSEGLVVVMAIDILFDFIATPIDMVMLELELVQQAGKLELLDLDILRQHRTKGAVSAKK